MRSSAWFAIVAATLGACATGEGELPSGLGGTATQHDAGSGGAAGSSGTGGHAGSAGHAGSGGAAGSAGHAGAGGGSAGSSGAGGSAGGAGSAGSGGSAGAAGSAGSGGSAGSSGSGGSGGSSGAAGDAGTCATGEKTCSGACVAEDITNGCADPTCAPCVPPSNSTAACGPTGKCAFACDTGYTRSGKQCLATGGTGNPASCPSSLPGPFDYCDWISNFDTCTYGGTICTCGILDSWNCF